MAGALILYRLRLLRKADASRDNSHHVFEDNAPLVTPAPPTLLFSISKVFFLKSIARIAAAYPEGPAPITTRSKRSIDFIFVNFRIFALNIKKAKALFF